LEIASLQSQLQQLNKQRVVDPLSADFQNYSAEVSRLKSARRYWVPVMEMLTASLPSTARMIQVESGSDGAQTGAATGGGSSQTNRTNPTNNGGQQQGSGNLAANQLNVSYEFADLNQVIDYMVLIQQSQLMERVALTSVSRRLQNPPEKPAAPNPVRSGASASGLNGGQQPSPVDQLTKSLENQLKPVQDEGDELLNQLRWMIGQQMIEKESGVKVPDKRLEAPSGQTLPSQSPITLEEYMEVKRKYEQNKQSIASSVSGTQAEPQITAPVQEPAVAVYQVTLQMTLKAAAKEK
jgi:hypothetical protein